jgi:hypothetical protein
VNATTTICPVKPDARRCSTCGSAKGCKDFEEYPARYKRLYKKYMMDGFRSLRKDEAIDLINAMSQQIHDLKASNIKARVTSELISQCVERARQKHGPDIKPVSQLVVFDHRSFCSYGDSDKLAFNYNGPRQDSHMLIVDWE